MATGKGVYVAEKGLVKYEGEWLNNQMEGHGVVEVDIPDIEPIPGSKLEAKMRAEGKIIGLDFMSPEDRKWLEMDVEDSLRLANGKFEVPYYEKKLWLKYFGNKPEKGRYRYAGQWKHGRMHGCGIYELNEHQIFGRFYFGQFEELATDCTEEISAMHAGIAEVAAAKARMFTYKPDGMVREERGPLNDPQHHYFYEGEDVWMAPGFVHQFHEVPDYWKRYVQDVDQEREMWLNSFYKSPLRIPMPSELEHWWSEDQQEEFVVLGKEPEPDPEDPSKLIHSDDTVILHTPTGRIINLIDDEEHGFRMCWQDEDDEEGEEDADEPKFLPLGFDEFYGIEREVEESRVQRLLRSVENVVKPIIDRLEKWSEEKKKDGDFKRKLIETELELVDAQLSLEEAIDSIDEDADAIEEEEIEEQLKMEEINEKESVDQTEMVEVGSEEKLPLKKDEPVAEEKEEVEDEGEDGDGEEEEEDDDAPPSSFGSVIDPKPDGKKGNEPGPSPFAAASLLFGSCSLISAVPSKLQQSFSASKPKPSIHSKEPGGLSATANRVRFPPVIGKTGSLRAKKPIVKKLERGNLQSIRTASQLRALSRILSRNPKECREMHRRTGSNSWLRAAPETDSDCILSMHTQIPFPRIRQS
ncbi:Protein TIC 100 [Linum grandiflorum]